MTAADDTAVTEPVRDGDPSPATAPALSSPPASIFTRPAGSGSGDGQGADGGARDGADVPAESEEDAAPVDELQEAQEAQEVQEVEETEETEPGGTTPPAETAPDPERTADDVSTDDPVVEAPAPPATAGVAEPAADAVTEAEPAVDPGLHDIPPAPVPSAAVPSAAVPPAAVVPAPEPPPVLEGPPSARLAQLGLTLPAAPAPVAAYVPAVRTGDLVFTSGQLPFVDGQLPLTGTVGDLDLDISPDQGAELARLCAVNALAAVAGVVDLDRVVRVVKVVAYVASAPGFAGQPLVANGASTLLEQVFGEAGRHARSAVGVSALPLRAPVEVELVVQVADDA